MRFPRLETDLRGQPVPSVELKTAEIGLGGRTSVDFGTVRPSVSPRAGVTYELLVSRSGELAIAMLSEVASNRTAFFRVC